MPNERGAFRRMVDYFTADLDRVFTVVVLAVILGGVVSCFGASCHVTISINDSKSAAERRTHKWSATNATNVGREQIVPLKEFPIAR